MKAASSHEFKVQYVKEHKNFKAKPLRFWGKKINFEYIQLQKNKNWKEEQK